MLYLLSPDHQNRALQINMITQEIRRHAALVALCAGNQVSKIATFLKTDKSFSYNTKWGKDESGGDVQSVVNQKKHGRRCNAVGNDDFITTAEHHRYRRQKSIRALPRSGSTVCSLGDLMCSSRIPRLPIKPSGLRSGWPPTCTSTSFLPFMTTVFIW